MFYRKMEGYLKDESLLIHCFHDSLSGSVVVWYNRLSRDQVQKWDDLAKAFWGQYNPSPDLITEKEMTPLFHVTFPPSFFDMMIERSRNNFEDFMAIGERIERGIRMGRLRPKSTAQASQEAEVDKGVHKSRFQGARRYITPRLMKAMPDPTAQSFDPMSTCDFHRRHRGIPLKGSRKHPNFSWHNQNNTLNPQSTNQQGYQNQPRQHLQQNLSRQEYQHPKDYKTLEKTLSQFMAQTSTYMARTYMFIQKTDVFMDKTEMKMQNQDATLKSLEAQVG
ncbi:hypothetical protein GQ457_08G026530 [Hibiscus cannabinus]